MRNLKRHKTKYPGVYYREHESRKHGRKPDQYFSIRYSLDGKPKEEGLGWTSEEWTPEKANERLSELKANHRTGEGFRTLAEKREIARQRGKEEEQRAKEAAKEKVPLKAYFEKIYYPSAKTTKKPGTVLREKQHFDAWILPTLGSMPMRKIVPLHLEKLKKQMIDDGKAPRTLQYAFATFRQVWNMAKRDGLVNVDSPSKQVKLPKINNGRIRFLSHEEADLLLDNLKGRSRQLHDIALLSLHTGMRAGEIFSLKWGDVDMTNGVISIKNAKGDKDRPAFMTEKAKEIFSSMDEGKHNDLVFKNENGERIHQISYSFKRTVDKLKFNKGVDDRREKVCFHTLRHTFASWHVICDTDIRTLQQLLGHASIVMTMRYSHLSRNMLQQATGNFEKAAAVSPEKKILPFKKAS